MGLFGWLRGKREEDPILGARSEPTGLEVRAVEATSTTTARVGELPVDHDRLQQVIEQAGGDAEQLAERLRALFPGSEVSIETQSFQSGALPPGTEQLIQQFFGAAGAAAASAGDAGDDDPIAQIERLAELHQRGALTDAEFAAAKAKVLGS